MARVFPTYVAMGLLHYHPAQRKSRVPHIRGDGPLWISLLPMNLLPMNRFLSSLAALSIAVAPFPALADYRRNDTSSLDPINLPYKSTEENVTDMLDLINHSTKKTKELDEMLEAELLEQKQGEVEAYVASEVNELLTVLITDDIVLNDHLEDWTWNPLRTRSRLGPVYEEMEDNMDAVLDALNSLPHYASENNLALPERAATEIETLKTLAAAVPNLNNRRVTIRLGQLKSEQYKKVIASALTLFFYVHYENEGKSYTEAHLEADRESRFTQVRAHMVARGYQKPKR